MADESKLGKDWQDDELDAIVADYFDMRFDPQELANWLRKEPSTYSTNGRQALRRIA
jgi:hypothetical protein